MKLGFGLYRHMLDDEHLKMARQLGATHVVVHLVDYFKGADARNPRTDQPIGDHGGWGLAGSPLWTVDELLTIRRRIESHGLSWYAVENFDPAHWHDVLLDGPKWDEHIDNCRALITRLGEAGIPVLGYNFSLAGVSGRVVGPYARGGALAVGMEGPVDTPIPQGMVWNMTYDLNAPEGTLPTTTHAQLWDRIGRFLRALVPVAEQAGVRLAAHPDDPPTDTMRGTPRLVNQPHLYQKLLDLAPSRSNALEYCVGTLAEMTEGDVYAATEQYAGQGAIAYVHMRNVRGKVPSYRETFIDEGDVDVERLLSILAKHRFDGVIIPDHAPQVTCPAPWYAGMAFAMGYLKATIDRVTKSR